jgi:hypothetical protein
MMAEAVIALVPVAKIRVQMPVARGLEAASELQIHVIHGIISQLDVQTAGAVFRSLVLALVIVMEPLVRAPPMEKLDAQTAGATGVIHAQGLVVVRVLVVVVPV